MSGPHHFLRTARLSAGLSQRALAARAGTAQSVVARIEAGTTSPSWDTLTRLLQAAGFTLDAELTVATVVDSHMMEDVARIRSLLPEARLEEIANAARFLSLARKKVASDG